MKIVGREENIKLTEEVKKLMSNGMNRTEACKKVGINEHTFAHYKAGRHLLKVDKNGRRVRPEVTFTELPDKKQRTVYTKKQVKLAVVIGSATEIKEFLNGYL